MTARRKCRNLSEKAENSSFRIHRPKGAGDPSKIINAPGVVVMIALANLAIFFLMLFAPRSVAVALSGLAGLSPIRFLAGPEANGGVLGMLSPLATHMFLHAGVLHLAMNMVFLLAFGAPVARRMGAENAMQSFSAFASAGMFIIFYMLAGLSGALVFVAMHANEATILIGASGGVTGLLGGLVRFAFNRSTIFGPEHSTLSPLLSSPVLTWTLFIVAMNSPFVIALLGGLTGDANVAWEAHLGGYFFGLLTYPVFERISRAFHSG